MMAQALVEGTNGKYIRTTSLNLHQILNFFKTENVTEEISFRPSGDELFVFKQPDILKKDDWKADGHLKSDYENYICTLLYPSAYRTSAFALRALNVELAQVQDVTSDKMRAIMRMQFWKDAINHIFQGFPPKTPVAREVARAVEKHKLSKMWMTRILEARASQIERDSFQTLDEVETLAENTSAALSYLLLQCAGILNVHADHAASHISRCLGLVTLLRATPFHASRSGVYVPVELLIKHNVSEEEIKRGKTDQKVKDVMYDIACVAHQHLETARSFKKDVPKAALPVFNNSVICDSYLKKLQLADFNVFDSSLQGRNNHLPLQLLKQKLMRTY